MRLFAAVQPSSEFRASLQDVQEQLKAAGVAGRYREPEGLHLTLAFIGEWPGNAAPCMPKIEKPFTITLSGLGIFQEAKVLWAGVKPSEELDRLAEQVRRSLAAAGIPFDRKAFFPHITLARKPVVPEGMVLDGIRVRAVPMIVDTVCLYRSEQGDDGMTYTVIAKS